MQHGGLPKTFLLLKNNARSILELCGPEPKPIIETIVTGDETVVLYYDPQSKRESIE